MQSVYIIENSTVAKLAAHFMKTTNIAIVFGSSIHIFGVNKTQFLSNKSWLLHELQHIEQYKREGYIRFIFKYLIKYIRYGYRNNPYEIEARNAETNETLLTMYKVI